MSHSNNRRRKWIVVAALVSLVVGAGVLATGIAKPGHFGHHRLIYDPVVIDALNLSPEQRAKVEALRDRIEGQRGKGWQEMGAVKAIFDQERTTSEPDLRRVVTAMDERIQAVWADKEALLEEGLQFYDSLSPEQKRTMVEALGERVDRMHAFASARHGRGGGQGGRRWHERGEGERSGARSKGAGPLDLGRLSARLNLNEAQKEAVAEVIDAKEPQVSGVVGKLESNRGRLRDMVEQGDYDQDALQAVADERGRLVAELTVLRTQMRSDIRAQLEADQRETLDRMWQHGRRWRGRF